MNEFFGLELLVQNGVNPRGITHIGAHYGQEASHYRHYVGENVVWVEAHPSYFAKLSDNPDLGQQVALNACVSNVTGQQVDFYITKDEYASSLLKPEYHQIQNPHAPITGTIKVNTITYGDLLDACPENTRSMLLASNVLVLDVQGAEMMVLEGMGDLGQFDAVATEYSTVEFYEGGPRLEDLDEFLGAAGFKRVFPNENQVIIHADALYVRA